MPASKARDSIILVQRFPMQRVTITPDFDFGELGGSGVL